MRPYRSGSHSGAGTSPAPPEGENISLSGFERMADRLCERIGFPRVSLFTEWLAWKLATPKAPRPIPWCAESLNGKRVLGVTQSASHTVKEGPFLAPWNQRLSKDACHILALRP